MGEGGAPDRIRTCAHGSGVQRSILTELQAHSGSALRKNTFVRPRRQDGKGLFNRASSVAVPLDREPVVRIPEGDSIGRHSPLGLFGLVVGQSCVEEFQQSLQVFTVKETPWYSRVPLLPVRGVFDQNIGTNVPSLPVNER